MPCALTQGYTLLGCKDGIGGIAEAYFIEKGNVASYTKVSGQVTAMTTSSGTKFYKYELQRNTSTFEETIESNPENGTVAYNQSLTIILNRLQTSVRNEILLLAKNQLLVIVKDRNGNYWLMGETGGLDLTTGTAGPGTAATDRSGYSLTFTGQEPELSCAVASGIISGLTA